MPYGVSSLSVVIMTYIQHRFVVVVQGIFCQRDSEIVSSIFLESEGRILPVFMSIA